MSHDHPDPALLVAYLDGTLFHRDAATVDRHVETCQECTALLASMRERRAAEQASRTSRQRMRMAAAVVAVALVGYGLWALRPRQAAEEVRAPAPEPVRTEPSPPAPAVRASVPPSAPSEAASPAPSAPPAKPGAAPRRDATRTPSPRSNPAPRVRAETRRTRQPAVPSPPRVTWRTREQVVESSSDGGTTWTIDHTADRPIRASVFVDADVAWVVGDSGLVLRRTKNGWFGASAPAEADITAVKASSPSRATVTLADGRVFTTSNGGVTWAAAP